MFLGSPFYIGPSVSRNRNIKCTEGNIVVSHNQVDELVQKLSLNRKGEIIQKR
jgi:hypothetical protein